MKVVLWQNFPNHLQSAHIKALGSHHECDVTLITQEDIPKWRQDLGWSTPDFGEARLVIGCTEVQIDSIIREAGPEAIHMFSGTRGYSMVREAYLRCRKTEARIVLRGEACDWRGLRGNARLLRGRLDALRERSRVDFVLAIGHLGIRWYRMCGYPESEIYPFGYFAEKPSQTDMQSDPKSTQCCNSVDLVFIGQCILGKGVHNLLRALSELNYLDWHLRIVGDGAYKRYLETLSTSLGISPRVSFLGAMSNAEVGRVLLSADLLVLPSLWDGWGVVVNEALMRGVPVVCSDMCGAADLLRNSERGEVFPANSTAALQRVLERRIIQGKRTAELTNRIKTWSRLIEGETAANYLLEVIEASFDKPKPTPPWLQG